MDNFDQIEMLETLAYSNIHVVLRKRSAGLPKKQIIEPRHRPLMNYAIIVMLVGGEKRWTEFCNGKYTAEYLLSRLDVIESNLSAIYRDILKLGEAYKYGETVPLWYIEYFLGDQIHKLGGNVSDQIFRIEYCSVFREALRAITPTELWSNIPRMGFLVDPTMHITRYGLKHIQQQFDRNKLGLDLVSVLMPRTSQTYSNIWKSNRK